MAFIGNTVQTQGFTPAVDYFSGNGSTVTFTLSRNIASVAQVICAIDNVIQNPSSSFTVSGNSITFTSAPLSGTNNIWVEYTSLITTYNGISQSPSVIGDLTASGGYLSTGSFNNSFVDGTIVDYVTGNGRITVGSADGFTLYNGGTSARSALASWTQTGALTLPADASISGLTVGKGGGAVASNTAFGSSVIPTSATGTYDTGVGYQSLNALTSGNYNTSIGGQSLQKLTTGSNNSAVGVNALQNVISGSYNSAVGFNALSTNTGSYNSALGDSALVANTSGASNTAVGQSALQANTTASNNTAVGYQAGYSGTTGNSNAFVGYQAGYTNNASQNAFLGVQAGYNSTCNYAVAIGYQAGYNNTDGTYGNTFVGWIAGKANTSGGANTFVGGGSGNLVTTGSKNTIIGGYNGNQGGLDIRTASNYIVLSDGDGNPRGIFDNSGNFAVGGTGFNGKLSIFGINADWNLNSNVAGSAGGTKLHIRFIGDAAVTGTVTSSGTTTSYNTSSDYRLKEDVQPMVNALDKVALLKPCTYKWKANGSDGQGFIAHELAEVFPDAVFGEKDALDKDGNIQPQGIDTSFLVATLVAAIQELKAEVDALKAGK